MWFALLRDDENIRTAVFSGQKSDLKKETKIYSDDGMGLALQCNKENVVTNCFMEGLSMRIAKHVVILTSCLLISASFSQSFVSGAPTVEVSSNLSSSGDVHLAQPSFTSPTTSHEIQAESNLDAWLLLLLAVWLVAVQLRRKQRILQAPRLASEAGESGIRRAA